MKIDDNLETVTCRICGEQCRRIYGKHLKFKHNNMKTEDGTRSIEKIKKKHSKNV
jgi:hypothetical protein